MNYISRDVLGVLEVWTDKEIDSSYAFMNTHPYLKFGDWDKVNLEELKDILKPFGFTTECERDREMDLGVIYYYPLKQI